MLCRSFIYISPGEKKTHTCGAFQPREVGEDLDVGFRSNMKVSLTFSALRWLLILVVFCRAACGTERPVDIYKLSWLRLMAFYKEKHLHIPPGSHFYGAWACDCFKQTHLNLYRESCLTLLSKVCDDSIFWKCEKREQRRHSAAGWFHHIIWPATAATRGSLALNCDQVKVCPHQTNNSG